MNDLETLSRERLYDLVWTKPTTEVAKELGVSDVAVVKLCREHQVPKPPPGYWARVQAGQAPPRSPLPPFDPDNGKRGRKRPRGIHLSPRKLEVFQAIASEIAGSEAEAQYHLHGTRLVDIDPYLASQILVRVEQLARAADQPSPQEPYQQRLANRRTYCGLADLLLPKAAGTAAVFEIEGYQGYQGYLRRDERPDAAVLHLAPDLQKEMASVHKQVVSFRLGFATIAVGGDAAAWRIRYIRDAAAIATVETHVCISADAVWLRIKYDARDLWDTPKPELLETQRLSIHQVLPVELLAAVPVEVSPRLPERFLMPYVEKLGNLVTAEDQIDKAYEAWSRTERDLGGSALEEAVRLSVPEQDASILERARQVVNRAHEQFIAWEEWIDREKAVFAESLFGVAVDDIILFKRQGKIVKLRVSHISCFISDGQLLFSFHGKRFRKDGMLGKRSDGYLSAIDLSSPTLKELGAKSREHRF